MVNSSWIKYLLSITLFIQCINYAKAKDKQSPNVLLIIIDDLRVDLGCYGNPQIFTPNIDEFSKKGIVFQRAYAQQSLCTPSRISFLTGYRPHAIQATSYHPKHFREIEPDMVTLPLLFKNNGYKTYSFGKVFHQRDSNSWTDKSWVPEPEISYPIYTKEHNKKIQRDILSKSNVKPQMDEWWAAGDYWLPANSWEVAEVDDEELFEGIITNKAIEKIKSVNNEPFFIAVGFFLPHIPYVAPKKYFDIYPLEQIKLTDNPHSPIGVPDVALTDWGETRQYIDIPMTGTIDEQKARELIRGYYASVSYVDAQIGRLLKELKDEGLDDNTIVVLFGDHGYHLGDLGLWGKYTNFENSLRVPFIIKYPKTVKKNSISYSLVELVDIYPTLADLAGLFPPQHLEGKSLISVFKNSNKKVKDFALSQYHRNGYLGYSIRTNEYRYTLWIHPNKKSEEELYEYDHSLIEKENLANQAAFYKLKKDLKEKLEKEFNL